MPLKTNVFLTFLESLDDNAKGVYCRFFYFGSLGQEEEIAPRRIAIVEVKTKLPLVSPNGTVVGADCTQVRTLATRRFTRHIRMRQMSEAEFNTALAAITSLDSARYLA